MNEKLIKIWLAEEQAARVTGWDFSHIEDRYSEDTSFPWDYRAEILSRLTPDTRLLDIDTGGGEFLLSLGHPYENTAAFEAYPPNVSLCRRTMSPLGIDFRAQEEPGKLPFPDGAFDVVTDRHGDLYPDETFRVLAPGGIFITQQVGAENDRELVTLLCGDRPLPFPCQYLSVAEADFTAAGFDILRAEEAYRTISFTDTGALVWFARVIEWEFPGFSVNTHLPQLLEAQKLIETIGRLTGRTHRFFLIARKPE